MTNGGRDQDRGGRIAILESHGLREIFVDE